MESNPVTAYTIVTEQPVRLKTCLDPVPPLPTKRDVIEDCCTCACCFGPTPDWAKRDDSRDRRSSLGSCSSFNDDINHVRKDDSGDFITRYNDDHFENGGDDGKSEGFDANWWSHNNGHVSEHLHNDSGDCFSNDVANGGGDCGGDGGGGGGDGGGGGGGGE